MAFLQPDIRANITLTRENPVYSGYRPAHLIGDYLTTGVHKYFNTDVLKKAKQPKEQSHLFRQSIILIH